MCKSTGKGIFLSLMVLVLLAIGLGLTQDLQAQTQRNPVLEFCTGTW